MRLLTIGQVSNQSGVGIETIRFYEKQGLLNPPVRKASGYRQYSEDVIVRLRFIRRAKDLGFSLAEIEELLNICVGSEDACADTERFVTEKIKQIDAKLRDLERIKNALMQLVANCKDNHSSGQCPILDALGGEESA